MAKVQRIPVGRKQGQRRIELPETVEVRLAELAGSFRQGLMAFAVGVGLQVVDAILNEDVTAIAGPKGKHDHSRAAYRHGSQSSSLPLGGRRVAFGRPRLRTPDGREIPLSSWEALQAADQLGEIAFTRMLAGVSTRDYAPALEPIGGVESFGASRSAVSRRFAAKAAAALQEICNRDLSELKICALFGDGIEEGDHTIVAIVGVDLAGTKHLLGIREGSTENKAVCAALLSNLLERGLDVSGGVLCVIDGGKGLRSAIKSVLGSSTPVQRCRLHKERNIKDHLPDHVWPQVRGRMRKAWAMTDPDKALRELQALARWLEDRHPGAAASLREGMEETLTITKLGVPPRLAKTMFSTNIIESAISVARTVTHNVKRWRNGKMIERWYAVGLQHAARKFRKVKGYKEIPILVAALAKHHGIVSQEDARVA